jgi:hypothetical protein
MNECLGQEMVVQLCFGGSNIDLDLAFIIDSIVIVHSIQLLMMARSKNKITGVVLHNDQDIVGRCISMKLEMRSRITLQPSRDGTWTIDTHRNGNNTFWRAYKGQILEFRMKCKNESADHGQSSIVDKVKVWHAYMYKELQLDLLEIEEPHHCNCE